MTELNRSHASVRSYYFRELVAMINHPDQLTLEDFRSFHRCANVKAREWLRQATNRYDRRPGRAGAEKEFLMSNPDRLLRETKDHALTLIEDRGLSNALAWAIHCANRSTDGFWSRVVQYIEMVRDEEDESESDDYGDRCDWAYEQWRDQ